jgi:3-hydroxybutyryl-CoA dehydratase
MAYFEDLEIGQAAEATHVIEASVIEAFGHAVGDLNPVHFDEAYAATTPFGGRIAHGMLAGGYISALIASALPGPGSIYKSQILDFLRAVRIGDELVVRVEITALNEAKAQVTLSTVCKVGRKAMVRGEAVVTVLRRPA